MVDAGIEYRGGLEAGRRIAEICMGGLGRVLHSGVRGFPRWPWQLAVYSSDPVLACLGSQYAGWSLSHGEGKGAFRALGSGPGRAAACREDLFAELAYRDPAQSVCLVLEVDKKPPVELTDKIARQCGVPPDAGDAHPDAHPQPGGRRANRRARAGSGFAQGAYAWRSRCTAWWMARAARHCRRRRRISSPAWDAPTTPSCSAGQVHLFVDCGDAEAQELARRLPSSASRDYGKPFARVFKDVEYDFYRIDPHLFAPAAAAVTVLGSGNTFHSGALDAALLEQSFGGAGA